MANLVQPGDKALVVNTGYFSDRIGTMLERHGAPVTHLRADPGAVPDADEVERALADRRLQGDDHHPRGHLHGRAGAGAGARRGRAEARRAGGGGRRLQRGRRSARDGRVGRRRRLHRVPEGPGRASWAGGAAGGAARDGRVEGAHPAGRLDVPRLHRVAAHPRGVRGGEAGVLRHASGEPDHGARREPRTPRRRGHRGARAAAREGRHLDARGVDGAGAGPAAEERRGERAHPLGAVLPRLGRRGAS